MIDSLTDRSMEMTFTVEEADLKKLQEVLCDIKIEECPWFEVHDKYGKSAKYYRDGLSGWIPCKERLPEENRTVIASTKYGVYPEARYTKEDGWEWAYESGADYWVELAEVKAWQPLPELYQEVTL